LIFYVFAREDVEHLETKASTAFDNLACVVEGKLVRLEALRADSQPASQPHQPRL